MKERLLISATLFVLAHATGLGQVATNDHCDGAGVTQCLIDQGIVSPGGCDAVGDPYLWEGDCTIAINRYISRAANMDGFADFNTPDSCWKHPDKPAGNVPVNCTPPYNLCWGYYCPETYCNSIKMLVETNTQFVARAATAWFHEGSFKEGTNYFRAIKQLICDVNAAYDCAGLRRPIIQAGIFEGVGEDVKYVTIPPEVINSFKSEMTPEEKGLYLDESGNPRTGLRFNYERMFIDGEYDIRSMETRLWFFHQATTFIDMGYTALHMGIYWLYARYDEGYDTLYKLLTKIRTYAEDAGSFVLINAENPMPPTDNGESAKWGDTDYLLFDFDGRAMRPREISDPQVSGDGGMCEDGIECEGCTNPVDPDQFDGTPCEQIKQMAILDTCTINSFGGSVGGISPLGCYYDQVPYFVYSDFNTGTPNNGASNCDDLEIYWDLIGVASGGNTSLTWGYDDNRWFHTLTPECRAYWWEHYYCERRQFHGGNGFVQIPGILILKYVENYCGDVMPFADGRLVLADDPAFVNVVRQTLAPKEPQLIFEANCNPAGTSKFCNDQVAPPGSLFCYGNNTFKVKVGNQDCSSTYSIHVQKPDGSWLPYIIGTEMEFPADQPGQYTIQIRQDNMGLDPSTLGTRIISNVYFLNPICCQGPYPDGVACRTNGDPIPVTENPPTNSNSRQLNNGEHQPDKGFSRLPVEAFSVYPNPAGTDRLTVEIPTALQIEARLLVYDKVGKVTQPVRLDTGTYKYELDISNWTPGVYTFSLQNGHAIKTKKVVVLK